MQTTYYKPNLNNVLNDRKDGYLVSNMPYGELIDRYVTNMFHIVDKCAGEWLEPFEILEGIKYSINKRYQATPLKVDNAYLRRTADMDVNSLASEILKDAAILTTSGVLFQKYGSVRNPFYNFIQYLLDKRNEAKNEMKKYPKGSDQYKHYNLLQLNYKVSCNALYGCVGQFSSLFFSLSMAYSVTNAGRGSISASICMFEGFLSNNIKFGNLNEVMTFIEFCCDDQRTKKQLFNDWDVLDRNITREECMLRLVKNCGWDCYVPNDRDVDIIWKTVSNLNQRELNIVYYRNNLYEFFKNSKPNNIVMKILTELETPYLNPLKPPEEIKDDLDLLLNLLIEYVYYPHLWIDKMERIYTMERDVVLITDTDSCIITLDEWYRFILKKTIGVPMKIKYTQAQRQEAADHVVWEFRQTEMEEEYDFYNQKLVDKKRLEYPAVVIEEDGLKYTIINIMSYVVGELILDYMRILSKQYNTYTDQRECLLIMKNEFLFRNMLLTKGRKNYATIQILQEGNIIPENKQFDVKGMPINKVGVAEETAKALKAMLEFDVLRKSIVDQVDIIKKFATLEKRIYNSISAKNKEFHKPARIKSLSNYEMPMRIQGIKASVAYNAIKSHDEESINLDERNTVLIIKTHINLRNVDKIMESHPEHYLRMQKLLENPEFRGKIDAVAIPMNIEIPDWVVPFINYTEIIHDNLRNFPMEEIGLSKMETTDVTHTNILKL